ncbi:MAG TPA: FAD:protein FMN transferase [Pirellulaceae bacterium]|nr:FAD:protein FMN transferase [Pirellulaceae bacterium]
MSAWSRRRFLLIAAGGAAAAGGASSFLAGGGQTWPAVTRTTKALGTRVALTVRDRRADEAELAIADAFEELALVERLMSIYRPDSQLSRLNATGELFDPHPHLLAVLSHAQRTSQQSGGAFDVTVQPLWEVFAAAQKQQRLPSAAEVAAARSRVDWRQIEIAERRVRLLRPGTKITLNGIAQGFAADRVRSVLEEHGIQHALIDAGELNSIGHSPRASAWRVGIQHPRDPEAYIALADLDGRALATSGDYATRFSPDGYYNHILDPRSGYSPTEVASVSVLAPSATAADALSTTLFVLGEQRGLRLLAAQRHTDMFMVLKSGETIATPGFPLRAAGRAG